MARILAFLSCLLMTTLASPAGASHCADGPAAEAAMEVGLPGTLLFYVQMDGPGVWEEPNGHAGLQTTGGVCTQKNSGRDVPYDADGTLLAP